MKILSVIPLAPIPISLLHYSVPLSKESTHNFLFGSIVSIPLRGRNMFGVVVDQKEETENAEISKHLKPILGLYENFSFFQKETFSFLKNVALWYHLPLSKVVMNALPKPPKQKIAFHFSSCHTKKINVKENPRFLLYNKEEKLEEEYEKIIQRTLKNGGCVLFLVPRKEDGEKFFRLFHKIHSGTIFLDATLSPSLLFYRYSQFVSGDIPILIGTRKFFFWDSNAPLTVILHHTHDIFWKTRRSPYFDARTLFHIMAQTTHSKHTLIASGVVKPLEFHDPKKWKQVDLRVPRSLHIEMVRPSDDYVRKSIFADTMFHNTFFNAWENMYIDLLQKKSSLSDGESLFFATNNPEHPLLQFFLEEQDDMFWEQELSQRRKFCYPPFGKIVKITFQKEKDYSCILKICLEQNIKILENFFLPKKKQCLLLLPDKKMEEIFFTEMEQKKIFPKIDINPLFLV